MRWMAGSLVWLSVLVATTAQGQIGGSSAGFSNRWGASVSGQLDVDGSGILKFAAGEMTVEAEFVDGVAQRTSYRSPTLDQEAIQVLLDENGGGASWQRFRRPGRGKTREDFRSLVRSDERGMAQVSDGAVTIIGPGWYQHLAEKSASAATGGTKGDVAPPLAAVTNSPAREEFIGFWLSRGSEQPSVVLDVSDPEVLSWVVFGATEQWSASLRWERETTDQRTAYKLSRAVQADSEKDPSSVEMLGCLDVVATNMLRWRSGGRVAEDAADGSVAKLAEGTLFERVAGMPPWKPQAPSALPVKGDSRETVLRLLGKPTGTMSVSGREVMVYPWGKIWIANGVVSAVD